MSTPEKALEELGLMASFRFVPESAPGSTAGMINWEMTLYKKNAKGPPRMIFRYAEGIVSLPRSTLMEVGCSSGRRTPYQQEALSALLEAGRYKSHKVREPKLTDVIYMLTCDAEVLDYACFEGWALNYGYDTDSRKAEKIYRECLEQSLWLRTLIGEEGIRLLKEAFQNY